MSSFGSGRGLVRRAAKSFGLALAWCLRFVRVRYQRCRLGKAERRMNRRMARLGTEVYSLYRQDDYEFLKSLVVRQQLKIVEEAERQVLEIIDCIEEIEKSYRLNVEQCLEAHQERPA
ncbi:MAG: hypothetical protein LLG06_12690 [Desulfobacteraceae bacterium]|nr:hypothetical protein [Desulfobacteraceae bacterium]